MSTHSAEPERRIKRGKSGHQFDRYFRSIIAPDCRVQIVPNLLKMYLACTLSAPLSINLGRFVPAIASRYIAQHNSLISLSFRLQLFLHNNNLSSISFQLLGRWDEVELVDLRFNPWRCDCDNQWMVDTLIPIIRNTTPALLNRVT